MAETERSSPPGGRSEPKGLRRLFRLALKKALLQPDRPMPLPREAFLRLLAKGRRTHAG